MYENLSIQDYVKRMQEWDDKKNCEVIDWIDTHWVPTERFTLSNGMIIQYKEFRGDLDGISKN